MLFRQKGPTRHAYAWQIGPFRQDTIDISNITAPRFPDDSDRQESGKLPRRSAVVVANGTTALLYNQNGIRLRDSNLHV